MLFATSHVFAAAASDKSKAVYLDEPEASPAPKVVRPIKIPEKYQDGTLRVEREALLLSDNGIVNNGKFTEYYHNGKKFSEGNFDQGVHNGEWRFWYDNGQLAKTVNFDKGKPDGNWEVYRADGTLSAKKSYKEAKRDGTWVSYYDDGKTPKIEQAYSNGLLDGPRTTFFANGKPRQTSFFKAGVLNGTMTEWDESGRKLAEATFEEGKLNGKLVRWGADGTQSEQSYRENKLVPAATDNSDVVPLEPPKKSDELRLMNSAK